MGGMRSSVAKYANETHLIVLDRTIDAVAPLMHDAGFEAAVEVSVTFFIFISWYDLILH